MQYKMNSNSELELTGLNENHRFKFPTSANCDPRGKNGAHVRNFRIRVFIYIF